MDKAQCKVSGVYDRDDAQDQEMRSTEDGFGDRQIFMGWKLRVLK